MEEKKVRRKMKKIISMLIAFILCLVGTVPVNAEASMEEIYDKVSDTVKITARNEKFYHDAILNM